MGWKLLPDTTGQLEYNIGDESFEIYVPGGYAGEKPYGLFVFDSPGGNGGLMREWKESIDRHELIWVGPNKAGNDRLAIPRMSLMIDAVHNVQKQYKIDPQRIYVSG